MSYYQILGLDEEPFSTGPDPGFFYETKRHKASLFRLRIAVELKRGLSVLLGDVGVGKTTLSRKLSQFFNDLLCHLNGFPGRFQARDKFDYFHDPGWVEEMDPDKGLGAVRGCRDFCY